MPIRFHQADIDFRLPRGMGKATLTRFITARVLKATGCKVRWSYIFCSDDYLLDINRKFLQHDYYTDIITFPLLHIEPLKRRGAPTKPGLIEAEIYISIDRVRDNAVKLKEPFKRELQRVIFHGALHLIGYQDKTRSQAAAMRQMENKWINAFFANI